MFFRLALNSAIALLPLSLLAQESPSSGTSPFRAGQWAVQFGGGLNMVNLGVLRFTSPRSAWLLDLDVTLEKLDGEQTGVGFVESADRRLTVLGTRLGRRFYQAPHGSVTSYQTLAIEGFYGNQSFDISDTTSFHIKNWSVGVSGELGAAYMVTPNLSLGGTGSISAGYLEEEVADAFSTTRRHGFQIQGIQIVFVAGFYF